MPFLTPHLEQCVSPPESSSYCPEDKSRQVSLSPLDFKLSESNRDHVILYPDATLSSLAPKNFSSRLPDPVDETVSISTDCYLSPHEEGSPLVVKEGHHLKTLSPLVPCLDRPYHRCEFEGLGSTLRSPRPGTFKTATSGPFTPRYSAGS